MRDLRYAIRTLWKAPIFTLAAVLTLALCIGANTAIYTVVDQLLLRPLPYTQPERLASVATHFELGGASSDEIGQTGSTWQRLHDLATTVDVASAGGTIGVNLVTRDRAEYVRQRRVSAGFFRVLSTPLALGREFTPEEDREGGPAAVILSYPTWTRIFQSDRGVVGRSIMLRGEGHTVVGVLPATFWFGEPVDVWTPLRPSPRGEGGGQNYEIIARLRSGVAWPQAETEVAELGAPVIDRDTKASVRLGLIPLQRGLTAELRPPLLVLLGAVAIVLLIGCVNIAGLLLARSASRGSEIAMRLALGAGRRAIVRQLLLESFVVAAVGGIVGIALGYGLLHLLAGRFGDLFGARPFTLDARVLAITGAASLCTSIVFGLFPAVQASGVDLRAVLVESGGPTVAGAASRWPRRILVVAEVALGVALLVGAGLLVRTLAHLLTLKPGFDATNVTTASLSLQDARYRSSERITRLFDDTLDRIRAIPGVQSAAVCLTLPYERALNLGWRFVGGPPPSEIINLTYVTPGYFETLRIPVVRGRSLTDRDVAGALPVIVVNEAFVRRHSPARDPVGRQIAIAGAVRTVVGVVGNIQQKVTFGNFGPVAATPAAYVPASQVASASFTLWHTWFSPSWVVRTTGPARTIVRQMQAAVQRVDSQLPFAKFRTLDDVRGEAVASEQAELMLLGSLAALAVLLSAIGIYGLVASSIVERTRELGIRLALGATARQIVTAAAAPGVALAAVGVAVGLVVARLGAAVMRHLLWGVSATDPFTFAAAAAIVLIVAAVAAFVPALRIVRLNPIRALRTW